MPSTTWNTTTIDGKDYLVIDTTQFRVPLDWDASSQMFIAVAAPTGGLGSFPALVKGDKGDTPTLDSIDFTALEADDPTPDSASWTETSPGVFKLTLVLHKGPQGVAGDTTVTPSDFGTPIARRIPVVADDLSTFSLQPQLVGDRYVPGGFNSTPSGNPNYTLATVSIPAQPFDWRPAVEGQCFIKKNYNGTVVDLIARLNNETSGAILGRSCMSSYGYWEQTVVLSGAPPAGASDSYDKVSAGYAATVYLRAERQSGSGTFTTDATSTNFCVRVCPIP